MIGRSTQLQEELHAGDAAAFVFKKENHGLIQGERKMYFVILVFLETHFGAPPFASIQATSCRCKSELAAIADVMCELANHKQTGQTLTPVANKSRGLRLSSRSSLGGGGQLLRRHSPVFLSASSSLPSFGFFNMSREYATEGVIERLQREQVISVMGGQWGDEGKGKLVDMLGANYDIIARCAGGSNAGHTVVVEGKKYAFHLMPSGVLHPKTVCLIGNGVVLHIPTLLKELTNLEAQGIDHKGRIKLSDRAHIVFDFHQEVDGLNEEQAKAEHKIGTTKRGIGPAYSAKISRIGIRLGDLRFPDTFKSKLEHLVAFYQRAYGIQVDVEAEAKKYNEYYEQIKGMIVDSVHYINKAYEEGKKIMIEGANATMLDVDFGTYPYVTSSNASIGGAVTGLGIAPSKIDGVIGIMKAYTTRVGLGPFPTELHDAIGEKIREIGREFGTTTGRPRRCGWLDVVALRYTHLINNFDVINLTKLDVLSDLDEVKIGVAYTYNGQRLESYPSNLEVLSQVEIEYETLPGWKCDISQVRYIEDLPAEARRYVERVEELSGCKIGWVGVGPGREAMAIRKPKKEKEREKEKEQAESKKETEAK
ncbi:Adenylosuccinate synthetase [Balamuthia mandrillaris]